VLVGVVVATALLVAGMLFLPLLGGRGGRAISATASGATIGVYAGAGCPSCVSSFANEIHDTGLHYAMDFFDGSSWSTISDPSYFLARWVRSNYQMIWGVPILPNNGSTLAEGAAGSFNKYFVALAQKLVADRQGASIIRLGWEFNGGWFPWAAKGQQANFIAYWHNIVTAMRSVPGAAFRFEWNPTVGDLGVGDLATYYPGNAYVDFIGLDVYDTAWASYPGEQAQFDKIKTEPFGLNWLSSFAAQQNKPIVLPEWGLGWGASAPNSAAVTDPGKQTSGGDDPGFIIDVASWVIAHKVFEATYWDSGTSSLGRGANTESAAALTGEFGG
jgi:Glycosyl hydrolase family 26